MQYQDATDYSYTAGLFDGEGTVRIKKNGGVTLELEMTDKDGPEAMADILGGICRKTNRKLPSKRTVWRWEAHGQNAIDATVEMLYYSRTKARQLETILTYNEYLNRVAVRDVARAQLIALRTADPQPISWDLETMGLEPAKKNILTCAMQFGDEEDSVETPFSVGGGVGEERLLLKVRDTLEAAPWTMGYNSLRFDIPFLNTRLAKYEHRPVFLGSHSDVSEMYKDLTERKRRTSLHDMANELGLTDEEVHKTPIDWDIWNAANAGDVEAMEYVVEHGRMDVILTKRGYDAIMQKAKEHGTQ